ncbi:5-bromo-4-chloroindolyl phosphate hydrolysis family protein [Clostridium sp. DJ247]|uniref:5-bromo-4-chloroindolyl phosphate hydrolysis family protein n=1 Tax=Clostridium sp. DJ247 TaxID=2726188 RepID=UPI00162739DD|nr:5-bromo-4-chloroindolyl phosphate hydrolysis family protein [Clostridium sp. DJ247]MBC2579202.1 5-bromo-4-chloroindolyl phosphate hydrolysis protein [Clostridium sp. DJ247]
MSKKDFSDLEDHIRDILKNAFDTIDFDRLKEDIDDKTKSTLNEVKTNLKNKSQHFNEKMKNKRHYKYRNVTNITQKDKNQVQMYISKKPVGSISGILYMILGFVGSGTLGTLLIIYSIFTSFFSVFSTTSFITLGLLFSFFLSSIALALRGVNLRKRVKRFKQYVIALDNHNYCSIEELAVAIRKKNKFVVKDLMKMIDLGMFPQAHIDDKKTYFMLNDEVYENYLNTQEALKYRNEAESKREKELNEETNDPEKKELRYALELGKNYIVQIKSVNDAIHREEISTKLSRLESIVSQIFNYVENNPKKLPEVNKFTNNYLPMTLKLVNAYKELNDQTVQGDNIKNAKNEIEKTIDMINTAFEKLLDNLFAEIALDISTDISVLETLFTQEGLTKNDFKK